MSSKEIKTMVNTLEKWLLTTDSLIENVTYSEILFSDYGKEFYSDYVDLVEIGYLYLFPKAISVFQDKIDKIETLEHVKKVVIDILKQLASLEKPKGKRKKRVKEILSKLGEKFDESIPILRKEWKDFESIFNEFTNAIEKHETDKVENEEKDEETETDSVSDIVDQMNLYQRINAYFVSALYAIMDVYCLSFLRDSLTSCSKDTLFDSFKKLRQTPSNPIISLDKGLDVQKSDNLNLKEIRTKLIKNLKWETHQESFSSFIEIRNVPAHQKTVLTLDELKERFPKQYVIAEKNFKQALKTLDDESIPPIIKKPLLEGVDDLKIGLFLREIGNSCLRYIVLHEAILQYYLNKEKFMKETTELMSEGNKG